MSVLLAQDQLSVSLYLPAGGNAENTMTANSRALQSCAVQGVPQGHRMAQKHRLFIVHLLIFFFLLHFSVETVNDGQFHSVELVMLNQTLNLVVDKGAPKSLGKLQKQSSVSLNTPLYIGGTVSCSRIELLTCFLIKQIIFYPMERALTQPLQEQPAWHFRSFQNWLAPRCHEVGVSVGVSQIVMAKKQINSQ